MVTKPTYTYFTYYKPDKINGTNYHMIGRQQFLNGNTAILVLLDSTTISKIGQDHSLFSKDTVFGLTNNLRRCCPRLIAFTFQVKYDSQYHILIIASYQLVISTIFVRKKKLEEQVHSKRCDTYLFIFNITRMTTKSKVNQCSVRH